MTLLISYHADSCGLICSTYVPQVTLLISLFRTLEMLSYHADLGEATTILFSMIAASAPELFLLLFLTVSFAVSLTGLSPSALNPVDTHTSHQVHGPHRAHIRRP